MLFIMRNLLEKVKKNDFLFHLLKYSSVGLVNTVVIFGLLFMLKDVLGVSLYRSNIISYIGGLICNFTLNKLFTFRSHKFKAKEIFLFLFSFGTSYGIQRLTLSILLIQFHRSENLASLIAYPLYGLSFFLLNKYLVFNPEAKRTQAKDSTVRE